MVRQLLGEALDGAEYHTEATSNVADGLELLKQKKFDILLIDLKMPEVKTDKVLEKINQQQNDISIIALVPYSSVNLAIKVLSEKKIFDYITKPFNIKELEMILRRAMDRQNLLHQVGERDLYQEMATVDGLTAVYNRRHLDEILPHEIERAKRYRQPLSLLMIDIDDFKKYNDTYGHPAGDKLLKALCQLLLGALRTTDMVFRYGGEEFVVLLLHTFKQEAFEVAKRLLNLEKQELPITVSIGLSHLLDDGVLSKDDLIEQVDKALYQAKQSGKNQICLYSEETG